MRKFAWSYSALTSFETCPYRHKVTRVTKEVSDSGGEHLEWGNKVHKAFEDYLNGKLSDIPEWFQPWLPVADKVRSYADNGWELQAEREVCINEQMQPTGWWDADVWCRGKLDVCLVNRPHKTAVVFDWKTGKRRFDNPTQLQLFSLLLMIHEPEIDKVVSGYVWLNADKIDQVVVKREDAQKLWGEILPRVERMKRAFEEDKWPKNPSGLCRNWCPVPKSMCSYSGKDG